MVVLEDLRLWVVFARLRNVQGGRAPGMGMGKDIVSMKRSQVFVSVFVSTRT